MARLRARYAPPSYAFFENVADEASVGATRWADAVAMGLWYSRGLHLHGFEIKASRSDWLRELKKPDKAEPIFRSCDRWWLVAADDTIVKGDELPEQWGLLIPQGKVLKVAKMAPLLEPHHMTRPFLAAVLRRAYEHRPCIAALDAARKEGREAAEEEHKGIRDWEKSEGEKLYQQVRDFEKASGIYISTWRDTKEIGEAVRIVLDGKHTWIVDRLKYLKTSAEGIVSELTERLAAIENGGTD